MNVAVGKLSVAKSFHQHTAAEPDDSISTISFQDKPPGEIIRYLLQALVKLWFNSLSVRSALPAPPSFAPLRGALRRACGTPEGVEVSLSGSTSGAFLGAGPVACKGPHGEW